jgi:threonine dehydrogenase-like Zn-dependent dehydrogenase
MRTIYFEKNIPKILLAKALRPLWPGIIYSPLSPTQFADIADEPLPGAHWIRVRNRLCGICATDLHLLLVETDPKLAAAALPGTDRLYLGHEVLGVVSEIGAAVTSLTVGDRVIMDTRAVLHPTCLSQAVEPLCHHCRQGNYQLCENAALGRGPFGVGGGWGDSFTVHRTEVYRVPDDIDDQTAMLLEPLSVGVRAALRRLPQADEHVLVVGCGIVGLNVVQALRALSPSCRITALARYPQQIAMARQLGAEDVLATDDPYAATARLTGAKLYVGPFNNRMLLGGFDVVFDCVGSAQSVQDSLRWTRAGGTVVLVGVNLARMRVDLSPVWYQEVNLIGVLAHGQEEWNSTSQSTYDLTCDLVRQGKLTGAGLITHFFRLEHWQAAIKTAQNKRTGAIKVVFDYRAEATT